MLGGWALKSYEAAAPVPLRLGAACVPSVKLLLNLLGTLRRYLIRPVPVVFLRSAFSLQLSEIGREFIKIQICIIAYLIIIQKIKNKNREFGYIFWGGQRGKHKLSNDSFGGGSFCDRIAHTACGSCSFSFRSCLFLCPNSYSQIHTILITNINETMSKQEIGSERERGRKRKIRENTISSAAERNPRFGVVAGKFSRTKS